jgi:hypothetical protein
MVCHMTIVVHVRVQANIIVVCASCGQSSNRFDTVFFDTTVCDLDLLVFEYCLGRPPHVHRSGRSTLPNIVLLQMWLGRLNVLNFT